MGRWTPAEASNDWTERTGLDVYQVRVSTFFYVSESLRMQFFGEWTPMSRTRVAEEDPNDLATFPPEAVTDFQHVWRFGFGFVF